MGPLLELKRFIIQYIKCLKTEQVSVTRVTAGNLIAWETVDVNVVGRGTLF